MLVENMTPLEVGAEIMKDWPFAITVGIGCVTIMTSFEGKEM